MKSALAERALKRVHLSRDLTLPLDVVTQTIGVVAKKRAGKSYFARKLAEQLFGARQQICIIDPKGDWWGILYSADSKGPGLPIVIIGGERGHIPLEASGGEVVAKLVAEERVSVLIDLSLLRKHEVATFMAVFLETLYRLKALEKNRTPMMLLIDEADEIAPQKPQPNEARMLGAAEDIVRRGGQRGIGCCMVTQRTAVLNKNVLTQCQILVALRTIGPQDRAAMNTWIDVHGSPEERQTLMDSLAALPVGDAWVWSPGWPTSTGIFQRIHTDTIETFDSGATPAPGAKRIEPKHMADVDLEAVRKQMSDTIERAKADDPRALRKQIADLTRERDQARAAKAAAPPPVEVPAVSVEDRAELEAITREFESLGKRLAKVTLRIGKMHKRVGAHLLSVPIMTSTAMPRDAAAIAGSREVVRIKDVRVDKPRSLDSQKQGSGVDGAKLSKGERRVLTALAQYTQGRTKRQLALLCVYAVDGGGFANILSSLRTRGYLVGGTHGDTLYRITDEGVATLGTFDPLPTGPALLAHWQAQLGKAERLILTALCDAFPAMLDKTALAERTGYEASGGGFSNALSRLRTLELIEGRAELRASAELMSA